MTQQLSRARAEVVALKTSMTDQQVGEGFLISDTLWSLLLPATS